jgi:hypothetical protein
VRVLICEQLADKRHNIQVICQLDQGAGKKQFKEGQNTSHAGIYKERIKMHMPKLW